MRSEACGSFPTPVSGQPSPPLPLEKFLPELPSLTCLLPLLQGGRGQLRYSLVPANNKN
jgi:hypothetical protein